MGGEICWEKRKEHLKYLQLKMEQLKLRKGILGQRKNSQGGEKKKKRLTPTGEISRDENMFSSGVIRFKDMGKGGEVK